MARPISAFLLFFVFAAASIADNANARNRQDTFNPSPIVETAPALAPFQHVRFCLRYPADCKSNPMEVDRIELNGENSELLKRINMDVNAAIIPMEKDHGPE